MNEGDVQRIIRRLTIMERFWLNAINEYRANGDQRMTEWCDGKVKAIQAAREIVIEETGFESKEKEMTATAVTA